MIPSQLKIIQLIQISLKIKFKFFITMFPTFMARLWLMSWIPSLLVSTLPFELAWLPWICTFSFCLFTTYFFLYPGWILHPFNSHYGQFYWWVALLTIPMSLFGSLVFSQPPPSLPISLFTYSFSLFTWIFQLLTRWRDPWRQRQLLHPCISIHSVPGTK